MSGDVGAMNKMDVLKSAGEVGCSRSDCGDECVRWVESEEFESERVLRNTPADLEEWNIDDVRGWIEWAVKEYQLTNVDLDAWRITGRDLKNMTNVVYKKLMPCDPRDEFWTHLQMLQKYGQVVVRSRGLEYDKKNPQSFATDMKLCKFLLNLLTDKRGKGIIRWLNDEGEFEFIQPDAVASMWGIFERNTAATFEEMMQALKGQNAITILAGDDAMRICKFDFNVREVLGYAPTELDKFLKEV